MQKSKGVFVSVLLFLILISIFFVSAENNSISKQNSSITKNDSSALTKELVIPPQIEKAARILFGLAENEKLDLQKIIVLFALLLMVVAITSEIMALVPFLGEGVKSKLVGLIIALIGSVAGALIEVYNFLFGIVGIFKSPGAWQILKIVIILFILSIFWLGAHYLIKNILRKDKTEAAGRAGFKVGSRV
ncbi:MAG: hypothetical protein AABX07_06160 [Nanoarchaeota archaeon]